jgi:phosphoglycerol transferase MdoB-like AlkP superfamily enzyme
MMLGPDIAAQRIDKVVSQIDLLPTALSAMGLNSTHPMIGRDLFSLADDTPGRAMMQYDDNNAYQVGNQVVIHTPNSPAQQFIVKEEGLEERNRC